LKSDPILDAGLVRSSLRNLTLLEPGKKNPTLATVFDLAAALKTPAWEIVRRVAMRLK